MQQLNEQHFITDFVKKVFAAILGDRNKALERAMQKDPEFQKIIAQLAEDKKRLEQWVAMRAKQDPALAKRMKALRNL